jgi:predicted lipoprotein with Yx(FWY)xxD motif
MTTKNVVMWIIVVVIIAVGAYFIFDHDSAAQPPADISLTGDTGTDADTIPDSTATTTSAVPGDNLTLGQNSTDALGAFLVAYNGMTLYTYAPDTTRVSNCTGSCATAWPPYTVTSTDNLVAEAPIGGKVSTLTRADGTKQVMYNGEPLYFYAKDVAPGDTKGEGVGGVWYVVKP